MDIRNSIAILSNLLQLSSQHTKGLVTLAQQCVQRGKKWSSLVTFPEAHTHTSRLSCFVRCGNDSKNVKMKTMYSYQEHRHAQALCKILLQYFNFFCSVWAALWLEVRKILICHDLFCSLKNLEIRCKEFSSFILAAQRGAALLLPALQTQHAR